MKRLIVTIAVVFIAYQSGFSQDEKKEVLFVGNSYTYYENLSQMVSIISEHTQMKLNTKKSTIGGAKLKEHWNAERNLKSKEIIEKGNFDVVVIQEHSMGTINEPDSIYKYGKLFCDLIKKTGAKPYLYLTWARERVPQHQETISKVYKEVAVENEAVIVPVGKAWELARKLRPNIELFTADGSHPSPLGTFLTACVFVATLTDELPNKLPTTYNTVDKEGETVELMRHDPLDIVFCLEVAKEVALKN